MLAALTHATEAFVSVYANDFTDGMALQAIKLIFANITESVTVRGAAADARGPDARDGSVRLGLRERLHRRHGAAGDQTDLREHHRVGDRPGRGCRCSRT